MARPKDPESKPLTQAELLFMNILWEKGESNAKDVLETLNSTHDKQYAYTTVSTVLRVLEKKGILESIQIGRGHNYRPTVNKDAYRKKAATFFVDNVFQGKKMALIKNLIGDSTLSDDELEEIRLLIDQKKEF